MCQTDFWWIEKHHWIFLKMFLALRSPLMAVNITISGITAIGALHLVTFQKHQNSFNFDITTWGQYEARVFVRLDTKSLPSTNTILLRKSVIYGQKKFYNIGPCSFPEWVNTDLKYISDGRRLLSDQHHRKLVGRRRSHLLRQRLRRLHRRPEDAQRLQEAERSCWSDFG